MRKTDIILCLSIITITLVAFQATRVIPVESDYFATHISYDSCFSACDHRWSDDDANISHFNYDWFAKLSDKDKIWRMREFNEFLMFRRQCFDDCLKYHPPRFYNPCVTGEGECPRPPDIRGGYIERKGE